MTDETDLYQYDAKSTGGISMDVTASDSTCTLNVKVRLPDGKSVSKSGVMSANIDLGSCVDAGAIILAFRTLAMTGNPKVLVRLSQNDTALGGGIFDKDGNRKLDIPCNADGYVEFQPEQAGNEMHVRLELLGDAT